MIKNRLIYLICCLFCACTSARLTYQHPQKNEQTATNEANSKLLYTLYMIGDVGGDTSYAVPIMNKLERHLEGADPKNSGVVFLGDNIYPEGLHKKDHDLRAQDEARLNVQLDGLKKYDGDIVLIPGNHDWDRQGKRGSKNVKRQEDYIQGYLDKGNVFRPSHGCPGPDVLKLAPGLVLIIIDTQWWLHQFDRPSGEKDGCDVRNEDELMVAFKDLLKKYRNQNVIVAAHHPLYSNGHHGGHFQFKDHVFPLTAKRKKAYVPFPIIGSLYPYYRKFLGHTQDITHPVYQDMKTKLLKAMNEYDNVIYAAGHEHNLQYTHRRNVHHIVSGSGSKLTYLKFDKNLDFGARQKGYSKIAYYDNGQVWLHFYVVDPESGEETEAYKKMLFTKSVVKNNPVAVKYKKSYKGRFATVVPDSNYAAGPVKRVFFGDLNRNLWTTPLKVPYLDINYVKGGLTPIKKGGGMQTLSLRVEGADGKQYTLRGIKKNATFLTESSLRGTIAQDVIYDGIAGSHPYASVTIPILSDAAGVYHANPSLVYVPKDSVLGDYLEEFGGMFCLFEERPDGDMSGEASFGNSKKVMNYKDAIAKMHGKYKHVPDTKYIVNARLFDMLIGDWDRHDDQWRWASFKEGNKTLYRPVPRDRDQAFFEFDGLFMNIANRKFLIRKFQPFNDDVRDISGLNFNARYFDRSYLIAASKEDWIQTAKTLQLNMTDQVFEEAIKTLPPEGYDVTGDEIIRTLKERRKRLVDFAASYYKVLAKEVSIPGTLKDDYFEVIRMENGNVEVNVYPYKKGEKVIEERYYHRVFKRKETKEIRLYGLGGKDIYHLEGNVRKSILVRIVGGEKKDHYIDKSSVSGLRKMTRIYESQKKNTYEKGSDTRVAELNDNRVYDYDRKDFVLDKTLPSASIGFNPNDGFYIGPGFNYVAQGFKKKPYSYSHKLLLNHAFGSNGYNLFYNYDIIDAIGRVDLAGSLTINGPLVYQYYGSGNEVETQENENYNVRMNDIKFVPSLKIASKSHSQILKLGLNLERIIFDEIPVAALTNEVPQDNDFIGASLNYMFRNANHKLYPTRGVDFRVNLLWNSSTINSDVEYGQIGSELRLYLPILWLNKQATINFRTGFATNVGDYLFFQSNFLNGFKNFRGVQRNRYAGKTSAYNNVDFRFSLFKVRNYIAPFDFGLLAHVDLARVWEPGDDSDVWHYSHGYGAFVNIIDYILLVGTYSFSEVDNLLTVGTRFFF